jgi:hypothetical protein
VYVIVMLRKEGGVIAGRIFHNSSIGPDDLEIDV